MNARIRKLQHARNGGRALFVAFGVLAIVGNVQAAPDVLSSRVWHALPPLCFLLVVEASVVWVPELPRGWARTAYTLTVLIGGASFALSYASLRHVAAGSGMGWGSLLFPILFELTAVTFSVIGIGASRAMADALFEQEETARETERQHAEAEQRAAERAAKAERDALLAAQREAMAPAAATPQAELDALTLAERYPDGLPTYKAVKDDLGWSASKVAAARKAMAAMGPAMPDAVLR